MSCRCSRCGAPTTDRVRINFAALCEQCFETWLQLARPANYVSAYGSGAQAQMQEFLSRTWSPS